MCCTQSIAHYYLSPLISLDCCFCGFLGNRQVQFNIQSLYDTALRLKMYSSVLYRLLLYITPFLYNKELRPIIIISFLLYSVFSFIL